MLDFIKEFRHQLRLSRNLYYANDVIYTDNFLMLSQLCISEMYSTWLCIIILLSVYLFPPNVFSKLLCLFPGVLEGGEDPVWEIPVHYAEPLSHWDNQRDRKEKAEKGDWANGIHWEEQPQKEFSDLQFCLSVLEELTWAIDANRGRIGVIVHLVDHSLHSGSVKPFRDVVLSVTIEGGTIWLPWGGHSSFKGQVIAFIYSEVCPGRLAIVSGWFHPLATEMFTEPCCPCWNLP